MAAQPTYNLVDSSPPPALLRPAVFLDRDGTINEQMGYINHISRFVLLPGVGQAIRQLNTMGLAVVVATNQSGLARGYFPEPLLDAVHKHMQTLLAAEGAYVDAIYVCPHHPEAKKAQYRQRCTCRKPRTGLLTQAARELGLDLFRSFMVGDRWSDLRCGAAAGTATVLVRTGYGLGEELYIGPQEVLQPDYVADDLVAAANWIAAQKVAGGR